MADSDRAAERSCSSFQVLVESDEAKSLYTRAAETSKSLLGERSPAFDTSGAHERHLTLPASATVGVARRCYGAPLRGTVRPRGDVPLAAEVDDATPLWQLSKGCHVALHFAAPPLGEFDESTWIGTARSYWRMFRSTWADYRSEG
mmetsp:Transcript_2389/g.4101  ORF Transcript_2389/g.4101 Transcript_2389/m.4101 type:complete len:146 (-) Transcript_2389:37-474(-)